MNKSITSNEIESLIRTLPTNKIPVPSSFTGEFCQTFEDELALPNYSKIIEEKAMLPNWYYKASITLIPKPDKDATKRENYMPISLMNIDTNILTKILAKQIQQYIKSSGIYPRDARVTLHLFLVIQLLFSSICWSFFFLNFFSCC